MQYEIGAVLVRDAQIHADAFSFEASYLREVPRGDRGQPDRVLLTRRAALARFPGAPVWMQPVGLRERADRPGHRARFIGGRRGLLRERIGPRAGARDSRAGGAQRPLFSLRRAGRRTGGARRLELGTSREGPGVGRGVRPTPASTGSSRYASRIRTTGPCRRTSTCSSTRSCASAASSCRVRLLPGQLRLRPHHATPDRYGEESFVSAPNLPSF